MPIILEKVNYVYMQGSALAYRALTDIDLTVNDGEFLGIIGHTGSGKSTVIQHLNGLILPTSGTVTVDGFNMQNKADRAKGRALVGMVFQYPEYQLFEETVARDIAFGPNNLGLQKDEVEVRVREAMALVGLNYDKFASKSPFDLSGGEKRRVALAGVIAMRPKYLVLDEPMAGLDPAGRAFVLNTIASLRQTTSCAVVMVSHSMDDIAAVADRIVVLNDGRIVKDGTPREVFQDGESLKNMGLSLPYAALLTLKMREYGANDMPGGVYLLDDMFELVKARALNV